MILEYIRYKLEPGEGDAFVQAYTAAAAQLEASPHCLAYELSECAGEPGLFLLRIEWTSAEDHLEGFRKSALFPAFFASIRSYLPRIQEMRHYHLTPVAGRKERG